MDPLLVSRGEAESEGEMRFSVLMDDGDGDGDFVEDCFVVVVFSPNPFPAAESAHDNDVRQFGGNSCRVMVRCDGANALASKELVL